MNVFYCAVVVSLLSIDVSAGSRPPLSESSFQSLSVEMSSGWLQGESHEMVYKKHSTLKVSQLDWRTRNVATMKGKVDWRALRRLTLSLTGWTSLTSAHGYMDDRDWLMFTLSPSENIVYVMSHSWHADTHLNYANQSDISVKGWLIDEDHFSVGVLLGYQQTRLSWTARGGAFYQTSQEYLTGNKYSVTGSYDQSCSLGYKQQFSVPYIGVITEYHRNNLEISSTLKYSNWVQAKDYDHHGCRSIIYTSRSSHSDFFSVALNLAYLMSSQLKLFVELTHEHYAEAKGNMHLINYKNNSQLDVGHNTAGFSHSNRTLTSGFSYRF